MGKKCNASFPSSLHPPFSPYWSLLVCEGRLEPVFDTTVSASVDALIPIQLSNSVGQAPGIRLLDIVITASRRT